MQLSNNKTKNKVIVLALQELINKNKVAASSLDGVKLNRGRDGTRLSSIPLRYIEAT